MNAQTETKADHNSIAAALAAAQAEMGKALKQSNNPHFRSKYADLGSVMDACLPALNRHGIAVIQPTGTEDGASYVETVLLHVTGERLSCRVPLIVQKNDMQGFGSAVTYARRYGLMAMAGIAPEDDDGNAAAKAAPKPRQEAPKPAKPAERDPQAIADGIIKSIASRDSVAALNTLLADGGKAAMAWEWLELEAPEQSQRVAEARDKRTAELTDAPF